METEIGQYSKQLEELVEKLTRCIKELKLQKRENEKLTTTYRFAAGLAHEINNPLAGIRNAFYLIKDSYPLNHPHYEYIKMIDREIDRIARIIKDMFNLYKSRPQPVQKFNIVHTVQHVLSLMRPKANELEIKLSYNTACSEILIHSIEDCIVQVLINIVQNAIEASLKGSTINIETWKNGSFLIIYVRDHGRGISEELRERIFEPFFSTKKELANGGLGLGLTISKSIIEALGGCLSYKSSINNGTLFEIRIPVESELMKESGSVYINNCTQGE